MEEGSTLGQIFQYISDGFSQVNNPRGLLIVLVATFFITHWRQVAPISALAVLIDFAVRQMQPVEERAEATFALPTLTDTALWQEAGGLFFGYLMAISLFFLVKWLMMTGTAKKTAH